MEFQQLVRFRRSIRRYAARPVEAQLIEQVVDAGRYAPSACNGQPWHFYAVQSPELLTRIQKEAFPADWFIGVPAAIVVTVDAERAVKFFPQRGPGLYAFQDTAAAVQNMLLCAADLGLASCWCGAFDEQALCRVLNLPAHLRPVALLPLGYPATATTLQDAVMPKRAPLDKVLEFL